MQLNMKNIVWKRSDAMDLTTQRSKGRKDSGGDDCNTLTGEHKS